ncbi:DNA topoisomerase IV subunit A [Jeotgalicoccus sp. ATCC 8456]|uniref:DNA topoisomerase IV subunit A n=1 Tax=Jeotgalicoccus sp. ATCC 8456 TaxID=946435 RepID=UPI0018E5B159|nr:DNA topoisomerase IV subunit A [Jeotgalicoccus sp. ATCC 8456]QQD85324.1 DNA topoisomerase IV subunit A [Jeotgalicoccus sp. ATCC 8456]
MAEHNPLQQLKLEDVIGDRFGRYSKYVIQDRAIPDVRDGLKPVQRRILYAMYKEGNTFDKNYRKSAKTVGNVIGNYHPHGESSIYDAMVRLGQDWKMREELILIHGNKGSVDGDPAAAMRYTEAKLAEISGELLKDLNKNTVPFIDNFDDTEKEPAVLPAKFPNLLVNGATGISAGYATDIPPHNLAEVIDATLKVIDKPSATIDELMEFVKGPDFPTGAIIQGKNELKKAYTTGKGRVVVRSVVNKEETRGNKVLIVITEIPFEVNKANLVKKMDEIRADRKVDGIIEVRDETDHEGLRIVIEARKDANIDAIINYLYKKTDLQVSYNFNMVAISDRAPKLMGLKDILEAYIRHQEIVITNRSKYELEHAQKRMHIIEGLIKALSILDEVIKTIRESENKRNAKENLIERYSFTEAQAEAIVMLQLYRLTNTDVVELETEQNELEFQINQLNEILNDPKKLKSVIKSELRQIKKKYTSERLTVIEDEIQTIEISKEQLIAKEEAVVSLTKEGYVKRTSIRSYNASNFDEIGMREGDNVLFSTFSNTLEQLLIFTNLGNYMIIPVHDLQDIRWKDMGQHLSSRFNLKSNEAPIYAMTLEQFSQDINVVMSTKSGQVKQTALSEFEASRISRPIVNMKLKANDEVIDVSLAKEAQDLLFITSKGLSLRYALDQVSETGLKSQGVKAMNVKPDDHLVLGRVIPNEGNLITVSNRGAVKRTKLSTFEHGNRAQVGSMLYKDIKSKPHVIIGATIVEDGKNVNIDLLADDHSHRTKANEVRISGKYSNGSFVVDEDTFGQVKRVHFSQIEEEKK